MHMQCEADRMRAKRNEKWFSINDERIDMKLGPMYGASVTCGAAILMSVSLFLQI